MKKIIFVMLVIWVGVAFADEPDNFLGFKFGINFSDVTSQLPSKQSLVEFPGWKDGGIDRYEVEGPKDEKFKIGDIEIVSIVLGFYKSALCIVEGSFRQEKNFNFLKLALVQKYGNPFKTEPIINKTNAPIGETNYWKGEKLRIVLSCHEEPEYFKTLRKWATITYGSIRYEYIPIIGEASQEEKEKAKGIKGL